MDINYINQNNLFSVKLESLVSFFAQLHHLLFKDFPDKFRVEIHANCLIRKLLLIAYSLICPLCPVFFIK